MNEWFCDVENVGEGFYRRSQTLPEVARGFELLHDAPLDGTWTLSIVD